MVQHTHPLFISKISSRVAKTSPSFPEKVALTAHVHVDVKSSAIVRRGNQIVGLDPDLQALEEALRRATHVCNKRFGIRHVTIQMTAIPEQGGLATCGKVGKTVDTCNGCS